MIFFPNCKINLGLYVTGKRPDGFHNIETCFYPIALQDVLEIIEQPHTTETNVFTSGIAIEQNENNSCLNAYALLRKDFAQLPSVQIHLHKAIPVGGGVGGGSADAAFTLRLLNKKFNLKLNDETLLYYAAQLGSDCAFFIKNTPCLATGRGEILQPIALDLSAYKIVLVNPGLHVNTAWAYTQIKIEAPRKKLAEIFSSPVSDWRNHLFNVFEPPVFQAHPIIKGLKETLYQNGAEYAAMTGSGASVYGLFKKSAIVSFDFPTQYLVKEC